MYMKLGLEKPSLYPLNSEKSPVKNRLEMDGRIENLQKWGLGEMPLLGKPATNLTLQKSVSLEENAQRSLQNTLEKTSNHSQKKAEILLLSNLSTKYFVES